MLHDDFDNTKINLETKTWLSQELQKFGDFRFTFAIMKKNNPSDLFVLSNYPDEWGEIYFANGYQYIDPVGRIQVRSATLSRLS
ncbi:autoinducer binding domain-containing protein [Erwinia sp. V71]|uniref:autoinducer binding domain-containing protein n=1 Tax=Erwinia sp. V71 TaxID=3369424 RepID=UPI003F62EE02